MTAIIDKQLKELDKLNQHRKRWLILSALVIISLSFILYDWIFLKEENILWAIGTIGLMLSIAWWYWTMRMIKILISHRFGETEILKDLYQDIKEIRADIKKISEKD